MTARLERLLATLQDWEAQGLLLPLDNLLGDLARSSGYRLATVQTYFAKGLEGHVIHGGSEGRFFVMGAVGMSGGDLVARLAQRLADGRSVASREAWRVAVRELAEIGLARGYQADGVEIELMLDALGQPAR